MRRRHSLPLRLAAALLAALFSVAGRAEAFVSVTRSDPAPAAPEVPAPESVDTGGGTAEPERRMALTAHEPIALAINRVRVRRP